VLASRPVVDGGVATVEYDVVTIGTRTLCEVVT
jgi:hypothetical protein